MKYFLVLSLILSCAHQTKNQTDFDDYLEKAQTYQKVLSHEGQYVMVFNPDIVPYVKNELTREKLGELQHRLTPSLDIQLTDSHFTKAAERFITTEKDETNYDAVWVRDSAWIYFALKKSGQTDKAAKLITALWNYYASEKQLERFSAIIKDPSLAKEDKMNVPHIRFNGSSKTFDDVMENGKPQLWNHRQNDAHGLFLLALSDAHKNSLVDMKKATPEQRKVLYLFPIYFEKINYHTFAGAGAWEEISKINTSSIAMVVKALEHVQDQKDLSRQIGWSRARTQRLIRNGYKTIKKQLYLGGESPQYDPRTPQFRMEDAALFNLFLPWPLKKLTDQDKRYGLTIIEKLVRPFGVIRYRNDSYQGGNYWIKPKEKEQPELTGDASSDDLFLTRFKSLTPDSEAQWFFDSKLSMIYSQFHATTLDPLLKEQAKHKAIVHYKRALGQITGGGLKGTILAADGKPVRDFQVPESINTVIKDGKKYYLASPITPLNWAKASLLMAGIDLEQVVGATKRKP